MSITSRSRIALVTMIAASLGLTGCTATGGTPDTASAGALTIGSFEPDHLTPGRTLNGYLQAQALFSPLTFVDAEGKVSMLAAESVTSSDAITWTIKLRPDWTFHNGNPVTAQDYVDTWNAVAYGPNAWVGSGSMSGIRGYSDLNPVGGQPTTSKMSGLRVVDKTTFTVELSAPDGQFPIQLSQNMPAFYPMPAEAFANPATYDSMPIGNGPFKMTAPRQANESFAVSAYDGFAGEKPGVKEYTFKPYVDLGAAYTDAQAGNIDILTVPQDKVTVAPTDFPNHLRTSDIPGTSYLAFPMSDPRFADIRVRQAFSMAIDRDAVNKAVFAGGYKPATAWTSPAEPGTPEGVCGEFCKFDPEAARALLAQAGGLTGTVELIVLPGANVEWEAYANQLRQNLKLDDVILSPTTDYPAFLGARASGKMAGPFLSGWYPPYPSQQNTLRAVFTPGGICAGCSQGLDPAVQAAITAADAQLDPKLAEAGYAKAQKLIAGTFPVAPLFNMTTTFIVSDKVADLAVSAGYLVLPRVKAAK